MSNKIKINDPEKTLEMVANMLAAVQMAGRSVSAFTWGQLAKMSAAEFMATLATNNMQVKYQQPEDV